jgi:hypothetical protein
MGLGNLLFRGLEHLACVRLLSPSQQESGPPSHPPPGLKVSHPPPDSPDERGEAAPVADDSQGEVPEVEMVQAMELDPDLGRAQGEVWTRCGPRPGMSARGNGTKP